MRVLLFITSLVFGVSAHAGGWEDCALAGGYPYRESAESAKRAVHHNLLDQMDMTPKERLRSQLPEFLLSNPKGLGAFNDLALNSTDIHPGRKSLIAALESKISSCFFYKVYQKLGSEPDIRDLTETEEGRELVRQLEKFVRDLRAKSVTEDEKRSCYLQGDRDKREACWQTIAGRVIETVLVPRVLEGSLKKLSVEVKRRQGERRVSRIEARIVAFNRDQIADFQEREIRERPAQNDESLVRDGHR
jgi:hypothetical protein